ncbi:hypothetical protein [Streptomyces sp. CBMAI 2042]|uniref:hypothetical protein n=1 Tax=Streptomyces sp. CBMAI 2042 TaxID=2305222 RepID=UPI001F4882A7|nr:hypothetical protein [Streptomyces sp. CBMAI 2042]
MCIRVRFAPIGSVPPYEPVTQTIALPPDLDHEHTVTAARAILSELAVPQPQFGARCFCGETLDLSPRVPQQRRSDEQVMKHV